ncbi:MAG: NAD(P)H-hydrate dehydratase [Candidatus Syntrophosphaera sp.]|nr:NAD(P)H-hydrate dehydratase [Candidatus Syntrophosphaera sp.]
MHNLLSSAQMKALDRRTIEEFGLPARLLMENAGRACVETIFNSYRQHLHGGVCVLCGSGNNGGDGAVIARWLHEAGCEVGILRIGKGPLSTETKANLELCRALDIPILNIACDEDLPLALELLTASTLVVDAVFGIGFKGKLEPWLDELFCLVNSYAEFTVAVDIPSGLNADTGYCGNSIYADATLCVESLKQGHILGLGKEVCGQLHLVNIGIPNSYYRELDCVKLFTEDDFMPPMRHSHFHKNDFGKVYVFGGIPGYTGASVMAAQAALRAGCGYVYVLHRIELMAVYALKLTEALSLAIPENSKTGLPDTKTLLHLLSDASSVLIGPGLGRDDYALKLLETVLKNVKVPLVVDADGLNLISENPALLKFVSRPNVLLTPHWGEFARLAGIDKDLLEQDCLSPLRKFVDQHQARVLLKSHFSIYHDADFTWVNISGNDGLATGGSGDVLAGIIASFLAQGLEIPDAAINASYLLGHTAELLAEETDTASILPTDIIDNLFVKENRED